MATKSDLLKSIRAQCLECCGGSDSEVKLCTGKKCSLYRYRLGKDPDGPSEAKKEAGRRAAARNFGAERTDENDSTIDEKE